MATLHYASLILTCLLTHCHDLIFAAHEQGSSSLVLGNLFGASKGQVALHTRLVEVECLACSVDLAALLLDAELCTVRSVELLVNHLTVTRLRCQC